LHTPKTGDYEMKKQDLMQDTTQTMQTTMTDATTVLQGIEDIFRKEEPRYKSAKMEGPYWARWVAGQVVDQVADYMANYISEHSFQKQEGEQYERLATIRDMVAGYGTKQSSDHAQRNFQDSVYFMLKKMVLKPAA